ncbi:MAG: hypothetical protein OXC69_08395 [Candidatus Tectomicrobia bacterium]|nr:hypothetical protein [Candidatus Tectomicrobia bacterium]
MPPAKPLKIEMLPMAETKPYTDNLRSHRREQIAQINGSIGEFGWTTPIVMDAERQADAASGAHAVTAPGNHRPGYGDERVKRIEG